MGGSVVFLDESFIITVQILLKDSFEPVKLYMYLRQSEWLQFQCSVPEDAGVAVDVLHRQLHCAVCQYVALILGYGPLRRTTGLVGARDEG